MGTDFLIVGAGSAGATLAARLSEDANVSVALAEGGRNYRSSETPKNLATNVMGPSMDTKALPDYFWLGYKAQRTGEQATDDLYWRGKGVGGSSSINGVVAFRAPPDDFDDWSAQGIRGWSFADVLPYFNRLEDDMISATSGTTVGRARSRSTGSRRTSGATSIRRQWWRAPSSASASTSPT